MAAERAQALGPLRFSIDAAFADETVYVYQSPDGRSSICVEFELVRDPVADTAATRLERAAEELTRVYEDPQISPPVTLVTGAGLALALRARVLDDVEISAAALDVGQRRVYVTATAEGSPASAFPVSVESIHLIGDPGPPAPPEFRRTGTGIVSMCVPSLWTGPSIARYRDRSAVVQIGWGLRAPEVSPIDLIPMARGETLTLDGIEQLPQAERRGWTFETAVSSFTVRGDTGTPIDAIMMRTTNLASQRDGRPVGFLLAAARSVDWPRLIQAWQPLVDSLRAES
jgi:hypothetical protein